MSELDDFIASGPRRLIDHDAEIRRLQMEIEHTNRKLLIVGCLLAISTVVLTMVFSFWCWRSECRCRVNEVRFVAERSDQ